MKKYIEKIRVMVCRIVYGKLAMMVVSAIFIVFAAFYYYGLSCEYPPNGEDLQTISSMFSHLYLGTSWRNMDILYDIFAFIVTKVWGMSYLAIRMFFLFFYIVLLCGTVFLCLVKEETGNRLYCLPLIGLFCVVLYPIADNPALFCDVNGKDLIYVWPYNYHYPARVYAIVCIILILLINHYKEKNRQVICSFVLIATSLYAMKTTDLVFGVMFMIPAVIVLLLHMLQDFRLRKYAISLLCVGMGILFLCRFLPIDFIRSLWSKKSIVLYGTVYGDTNWSSISAVEERLFSYIEMIFVNFNIQLSEAPVISFYTIIYIFKIAILAIGYVIMFHILKCSLTQKCLEYHYDCVDEVLAWSYFLLSCVYIFTEHGDVFYTRYFSGLITTMTILLCRNLEIAPQIIRAKWFHDLRHKKVLLFEFTFIICFCNMGKVWTYHAPNEYDDDLRAIVAYIEGTDLGYAVAPYWLSPRASALSEGKVMVYQTQERVKEIYGENAQVTYIITHNNNSLDCNEFAVYDHCKTYEEMCEYYSFPTDVIIYDKLKLVVYEEGLD